MAPGAAEVTAVDRLFGGDAIAVGDLRAARCASCSRPAATSETRRGSRDGLQMAWCRRRDFDPATGPGPRR